MQQIVMVWLILIAVCSVWYFTVDVIFENGLFISKAFISNTFLRWKTYECVSLHVDLSGAP